VLKISLNSGGAASADDFWGFFFQVLKLLEITKI
jgi:hypothetical protein